MHRGFQPSQLNYLPSCPDFRGNYPSLTLNHAVLHVTFSITSVPLLMQLWRQHFFSQYHFIMYMEKYEEKQNCTLCLRNTDFNFCDKIYERSLVSEWLQARRKFPAVSVSFFLFWTKSPDCNWGPIQSSI